MIPTDGFTQQAFHSQVVLTEKLQAAQSRPADRDLTQSVRGRKAKDAIIVDVVEGNPEHPVAIYDLKTGGAELRPSRISQIRSHLPDEYKHVPIIEVRVEGP